MPTTKQQRVVAKAATLKGSFPKEEILRHGDGHGGNHQDTMVMTARSTFAEMLLSNPKALKMIKLPKWFLIGICKRKEQGTLTATERARFLCAYSEINANGTLGELVKIHSEPHQMHGTDRFLPWHRVFLLAMEEALHAVHPDVCIPCWDWTKASSQNFPSWLASYLPTVVTPTSTVTVTRSPQSNSSLATIASNTPNTLAQTTFSGFTSSLEAIHGSIHVWVGGSMGFISTAPADPIFWMHHANIDRLWWIWQNSAQGAGKNPPLSGAAAVMDPYPTAEPSTRNIISMGFNYV